MFITFRKGNDIDAIIDELSTLQFFVFLEKLVEFSVQNKHRYFKQIMKLFNAIYVIDCSEALVDLFVRCKPTFYHLFDQLHPNGKVGRNTLIISLLANVAYSSQAIANELVDKGYFNGAIELLDMDSKAYISVLYALDLVFDMADESHSTNLFNYNKDTVNLFLRVSEQNITNGEFETVFSIILFMLKINDGDTEFVNHVTNSDRFIAMQDRKVKHNTNKAIEAETL